MATNEENNDKQDDQQKEEDLDFQIEVEGEPAGSKQKEAGEADDSQDDETEERRAKSGGEDRDNSSDKDEENLTPEQKTKREKRREERRLRKQRQEERERRLEALEARNAELEARLNQTTQRLTSDDHQRVVAALNAATNQMQEARRLMEEAKAAENWGAHADAMEAFYEARARAERANVAKVRMEQAAAREEQGDGRRGPDPEVMRAASAWRAKNTWYDPGQRDGDSKIAAAIDAQLAEEGYNPRTPAYWKELDKRIAQQLPHRATRDNADELDEDLDDLPDSPTKGSGRERASSGKRVVKVSRERIEALKEAGVDVTDRKAMAPYLRRFAQWDKDNAHLFKGQ